MAVIDIRTEDEQDITEIQFANNWDIEEDTRDVASTLCKDVLHKDYLFLHCENSFMELRKSDVKNLIKALQKSLEIWKD